MEKKCVDLGIHSFKGPQFEDHGLEIDVLNELIIYKNILVETAKELWRKNNPDRSNPPKNFEDSLNLKFYELRGGSTAVPLTREIEFDPSKLPYGPPRDELDEAAELVADVVEAASRDAPFPEKFPKRLVPMFKDYGKNLKEGESFEQKPLRREKPAVYSFKTRERIIETSAPEYEDLIELVGEIRSADLDGQNFNLRIKDGTKIPGKFNPEQEEIITNALREHATRQLIVKGRAEFYPFNRNIKRIISISSLILQQISEAQFDENARPIWEVAMEIGAAVPDKEWEKAPKDLAANIDHYLYGHSKDR